MHLWCASLGRVQQISWTWWGWIGIMVRQWNGPNGPNGPSISPTPLRKSITIITMSRKVSKITKSAETVKVVPARCLDHKSWDLASPLFPVKTCRYTLSRRYLPVWDGWLACFYAHELDTIRLYSLQFHYVSLLYIVFCFVHVWTNASM